MRSLSLLLVEDDDEDARIFRRYCGERFRVAHVRDTSGALEAVATSAFDLCFTDYHLQLDSGLDLVRALRAAGNRMPIVIISGHEIETLGENALLAGATDFITKAELSPPAIERASRWALVRRHAENRARTDAIERAVTLLMGRGGTARTVAGAAPAVRRLIYLSRCAVALSPSELMALCSASAARNARTGITGMLVHAGCCFVQVVEGSDAAVGQLLDRLRVDDRHRDITLVRDETTDRRAFDEWNMASLPVPGPASGYANNWMNVVAGIERELSRPVALREAVRAMVLGLPALLSGKMAVQPGAVPRAVSATGRDPGAQRGSRQLACVSQNATLRR